MTIKLDKDVEERLIASIKRYFDEHLETQIGDLKATLLLRFVLKELAPCVYNRAVGDVQTHLRDLVEEIDGTCFEREFDFWAS